MLLESVILRILAFRMGAEQLNWNHTIICHILTSQLEMKENFAGIKELQDYLGGCIGERMYGLDIHLE